MKKYIGFAIIAIAMGLSSCNDFLDKLPDDRAEVNSVEKVSQFLVSAYPNHLPNFIFEISSDNVMDNGAVYTAQPNQDKIYRWENVETEGNDDPRSLWNNGYESAAYRPQEAVTNFVDLRPKHCSVVLMPCSRQPTSSAWLTIRQRPTNIWVFPIRR